MSANHWTHRVVSVYDVYAYYAIPPPPSLKAKGREMNANYSYVDTNAEILEIGIELGIAKEWLTIYSGMDIECLTTKYLDRCLELWIKYNQITEPCAWQTTSGKCPLDLTGRK
jgi:hypothetical protein